MPINILMPALSPTMEKGNLSKWLKKEGDAVKTGDVIAEIETDKATMEYEAVDDGVMAKIVVPEGTNDVAVNQLIAVMAQEGEDVKAAAARQRGQASESTQRRSPLIPTFSPSGRRSCPASRRAFDIRSSAPRGEISTAAGTAARSLSPEGRGWG